MFGELVISTLVYFLSVFSSTYIYVHMNMTRIIVHIQLFTLL